MAEIMKAFLIVFLVIATYGQSSEGTKDPRLTMSQNRPARSSDPIGEKYMELYHKVHIFLGDAINNSLTATEVETSQRTESYGKVFSEGFLNKAQIYDIILIEKYLQEIAGLFPAEYAVTTLYENLNDCISSQIKPAFDAARPLFYSMALFSLPQIDELIEEKNGEFAKEEYNNTISKKKFWSINELKLKGKPNDCIAYDNNSYECLITIGQFNASIPLMNISKKYPKDSARTEIIHEILSDIYLSKLAIDSGYTDKLNTKEMLAKKKVTFKKSQKHLTLGRIVTDEDILFSTYKKYYEERFFSRDEVYINIIGSTDSNYIDSVYTWLYQESKNDSLKEHAIKQLPWHRSNWNDLPDELVLPTDTINENEFTKPVKTPYGYFIAHLDEVIRHKTTFEEAYDELVYLATRDKWQNTDSLREERAYEYYSKNKGKYVTPDTMDLSFCLLPCSTDVTKGVLDSSSLKKLRLSSIQLPFEVQDELKIDYNKKRNKKGLLGPMHTRYGTFYFQVHNSKPGGKQYSFDQVYEYILAEIKTNEKRENFVHAKDQKVILDRMFLGKMYFIDDISKVQRIDDAKIRDLIENGKIDVSAVKDKSSEKDCLLYGKAQYERMKIEKYEENINNWVKNIKIEKTLF